MIPTLIAMHVVLPLAFVTALWAAPHRSKLQWAAMAAMSGAFLAYRMLSGRWDWISYYFPFLVAALYVAAAAVSFRRARGLPWRPPPGRLPKTVLWTTIAIGAVFVLFLVESVRGRTIPAVGAVDLRFPLEDGVYYVSQGGDTPLVNAHTRVAPQTYALDIVRLNAFGRRAAGLYPSDLERYEIYGREVSSPCAGVVVSASASQPDLAPPATDRSQPAGNHVAIECRGVTVILAQLMKGSLLVQVGDRVAEGLPIARVGNSGNTSEPHLHIHAVRGRPADLVREGEPVPLRFDGRFLARNSLVWR